MALPTKMTLITLRSESSTFHWNISSHSFVELQNASFSRFGISWMFKLQNIISKLLTMQNSWEPWRDMCTPYIWRCLYIWFHDISTNNHSRIQWRWKYLWRDCWTKSRWSSTAPHTSMTLSVLLLSWSRSPIRSSSAARDTSLQVGVLHVSIGFHIYIKRRQIEYLESTHWRCRKKAERMHLSEWLLHPNIS